MEPYTAGVAIVAVYERGPTSGKKLGLHLDLPFYFYAERCSWGLGATLHARFYSAKS